MHLYSQLCFLLRPVRSHTFQMQQHLQGAGPPNLHPHLRPLHRLHRPHGVGHIQQHAVAQSCLQCGRPRYSGGPHPPNQGRDVGQQFEVVLRNGPILRPEVHPYIPLVHAPHLANEYVIRVCSRCSAAHLHCPAHSQCRGGRSGCTGGARTSGGRSRSRRRRSSRRSSRGSCSGCDGGGSDGSSSNFGGSGCGRGYRINRLCIEGEVLEVIIRESAVLRRKQHLHRTLRWVHASHLSHKHVSLQRIWICALHLHSPTHCIRQTGRTAELGWTLLRCLLLDFCCHCLLWRRLL
mmetsp:Transcript_3067/g.7122  ORF Transcript_3067/g.7122 Transcript_3067/m.7122 type:complete len:292 (+) Transcript_3067:92-967(+)